MANTRTRLLKLLANAVEVLSEAELLASQLPIDSEEERQAIAQLPELRETVRRVEKMLNDPGAGQ